MNKVITWSMILSLLLLMLPAGCKKSGSSDDNGGALHGEGPIQSLEIIPGTKKIVVGQKLGLQARAHYANGATSNLTGTVTWSSSDESIAKVGNEGADKGAVQGLSLGTATIHAGLDGFSGSAEIIVSENVQGSMGNEAKIIFLHHSTGQCIWSGGISEWFSNHNSTNEKAYSIVAQPFPKSTPYGWNNYPYDYWNIWVNHAGPAPYQEEPTLEMLTQEYNVIVLKHCYPVSDILPDTGSADIASQEKRVENYKLQYQALKNKMRESPDVRFIIWTGAARVQGATTAAQASRARSFFDWVKAEWDEPGDNIYLWDFFELETEGGLYLKNEYAQSPTDSHPNSTFSARAAAYLCNRIIDVIEGSGDTGSHTGR